ncbi:MAG: flagellar biosynthesis protein FlhF [Chitinivibrionales bacterium]
MRIRKYTASSMKEALIQIKQDLGEEAMILKTRKIPGKLFGLGTQDEVEVTAAIDDSSQSPQPLRPLQLTRPATYNRPRPAARVETAVSSAPRGSRQTQARPPVAPAMPSLSMPVESERKNQEILELRQEIRELKDVVRTIASPVKTATIGSFSGVWTMLYKRLVEAEIKPLVAEDLIKEMKEKNGGDQNVEKSFISVLRKRFKVSGPIAETSGDAPKVIAFVGPTGAGKTTSLAKLAAHYCLEREKKVSIITADTYRIAAIEQIRAFADIVNVGLQVIFSPDEAQEALGACEDDDIVFVDTAGRSQRNKEHMHELEKVLQAISPDEIHLVLSATTKDSDLLDVIKRYRCYGISRLLFTKLDETVQVGNIFNISCKTELPESFFSVGQSVPDDIELAQTNRFVQMLWERSKS